LDEQNRKLARSGRIFRDLAQHIALAAERRPLQQDEPLSLPEQIQYGLSRLARQ